MNFAFDEDQHSLGDTVASVLGGVASLTVPDLNTEGNDEAWAAVAELGLFALLVPEEHGGVGLSLVDLALAIEALGAGLAPPLIASTLIATDVLLQHGSAALKETWLPRIAAGEARIAIASFEAGSDYEPASLKMTSTGGMLDGRKLLVAGGTKADAFLVLGTYAGETACWLVDAKAGGVAATSERSIDPAAELASVAFTGAPGERLQLGSAAARTLEAGATVTAGMTIGIAARMLSASVEYASTRIQFGQPIGAFQAIKHRCADMAVAVEAGRSAAYYAFWAIGEGDSRDRRAASMAKAYCGDVARSVCNEAVQIHGGMGFTWELGIHRYLRRTKLFEHQFGDSVYHREQVVSETFRSSGGTAQCRDAA
nr:acyl-CoA dehydrogenase family protein [uncultured Sphingomonas sp.]